MSENKLIHRNLFFLSVLTYYLYCLFRQLDFTFLFFQEGIFLLEKITIMFSLSCLLFCGRNKVIWLILFLVLFSYSLFFFFAYEYRIIASVCLIFAATNLESDYITKSLYKSLLISFVIVFVFLALGITVDTEMLRDEEQVGVSRETAHTFGFYHYSGFSFRMTMLSLLYLCVKRFILSWYKILLLLFVNIFVFMLTETRLQIISVFLFVLSFVFVYKYKVFNLCNPFWKFISLFAYIGFFLFFFIIGFSSSTSFSDLYEWWDMKFTGRMSMTLLAFATYSISLWGNKIEMIGARDAKEIGQESFYIDSGYAYWILAYGVLFTFLLLIMYTTLMYKAYKKNIFYLYVWLFVFSIMNLINDFFNFFDCNPVLLYFFAKLREEENT